MRCSAAIAAFALVLSVPVWAQRGGGHAGGFGGGHGGFGGGHVGGFAGHVGPGGAHFNHSMGRMHGPGVSGGFTHIRSAHTGFSSHGPFMHDGFRGDRFHGDRFGHDRFHRFRFRNCFGFGCWGGYPWAYAYYDPWWWWDSGSSYDEDSERDRLYAEELNLQNLEEQRMLRQEEAERDREASARTAPAPAPREEKESAAVMSATVLVFRDQHKREVDNYAIIGQTLWAFAPQRTEKIPLADLDLAATTKANDDRGLTFRVPTANEAQ